MKGVHWLSHSVSRFWNINLCGCLHFLTLSPGQSAASSLPQGGTDSYSKKKRKRSNIKFWFLLTPKWMLFPLKMFLLEKAAMSLWHGICTARGFQRAWGQRPDWGRMGQGSGGSELEQRAEDGGRDKGRGSMVHQSWLEDQLLNFQELCRLADTTFLAWTQR